MRSGRKKEREPQAMGWYINREWREAGIASLAAVRRAPDGRLVLAAFLVDVWCTGLKDAWGRVDMPPGELDRWLSRTRDAGMEMVSVDEALARRLVAGGVRFARQNGFRLPKHFERWIARAGGVGDLASADLADFGKDGKLLYVGTLADLRKRLIGCPVEEFLGRRDVDFIMGPAGGDPAGEDMEDLQESMERVHAQALRAVTQWCFVTGQRPHPRLAEALQIIFEAGLQTGNRPDGEPDYAHGAKSIGRTVEMAPAPESRQLAEAMHQLQQFMSQFPTPEAFCAAMATSE